LRIKFDAPSHNGKWIGRKIWVGKCVGRRIGVKKFFGVHVLISNNKFGNQNLNSMTESLNLVAKYQTLSISIKNEFEFIRKKVKQ